MNEIAQNKQHHPVHRRAAHAGRRRGGRRAPSTPPTCSSRRWRAASCSASAPRRSTSTASTSRRTARSSGASRRSSWSRPRSTRRSRSSRGCARSTRTTTGCSIPDETLARGGEALRALHHRPVPAGQGHRRHRRGGRPRAAGVAGAAARGGRAQGRAREGERARRKRRSATRTSSARRRCATSERDLQNQIRLTPGGVGEGAADPPPDHRRGGHRLHRVAAGPASRSPGCRRPRPSRLLRMEDELHGSVVGQDEAIKAVVARHPALARRAQGPEPAHRLVHLLRPDRRRQDRAGARAGQVPLRRPVGADPRRHVGVHGEVLRVPADRRAARATSATRIRAR